MVGLTLMDISEGRAQSKARIRATSCRSNDHAAAFIMQIRLSDMIYVLIPMTGHYSIRVIGTRC